MAKKNKELDKAVKSIDNLYANGGIVNLGKNPRYPEKVRTGRPSMDYVTDGGFPKGRLVLIAGEPSAGKSSLVIQLAELIGKRILYCDTEMTLTTDYIEQLGGDPSNFSHFIPETTEQMCNVIREQIPNYDVIIVDSINNSASEEQMKKLAEERTMANRAIVMSAQLPILVGKANQYNTTLIILSQVRDNMNKVNKWSPDTVVPGGRSLHHNSSMTLELFKSTKQKETDKDSMNKYDDVVVGHMVRVVCSKNKVGEPNRVVDIEFRYDDGYTDTADYIGAAYHFKILEVAGSWIKYNGESLVQGKDKVQEFMKQNPEIYKEIKEAVDFEIEKILQE